MNEHAPAAEGLDRGELELQLRFPGLHQALGGHVELVDLEAPVLDGGRLEFGAEMDERSILSSTVTLFAGAVVLAVVLLALALWAVVRQGRKDLGRPA